MELFERLGFGSHPFVHTNADEEPFLERYFVPPPFFDAVKGDPGQPTSVVVLAPRGSGKSAQRRQLAIWAEANQVLAVTYDRFEFGVGQELESIGLPYHLRNVITRTLVSYLSYLIEYPDTLLNLSKQEKRVLAIFVHSYLGDTTGLELRKLLDDLKGLPDRLAQKWKDNVGVLDPVINWLLATYGLPKLDMAQISAEEKTLSESYKNQLGVLWGLVKKLDFKAIYVLVDKPDETEKTGNSPEATYRLVRPLLQDLELLCAPGYAFKFFLWDQLWEHFRQHARPDRVPQHEMSWTRESLQLALSRRLEAFSEGRVDAFSQLMDQDTELEVDATICLIADRSPRNVVRICEKIFAAQAELDPSAAVISDAAVEKGVDIYCEQVVKDRYTSQAIRDLQKVGRELFTINYLSNDVFKNTHANTSRNKVTSWTKSGLVTQIGTVSTPDAGRPLNFYYVVDPAMVRSMNRGIPLGEFIRDRWLPCGGCGRDNFMDLSLFPDGNDPECFECGRPLL